MPLIIHNILLVIKNSSLQAHETTHSSSYFSSFAFFLFSKKQTRCLFLKNIKQVKLAKHREKNVLASQKVKN